MEETDSEVTIHLQPGSDLPEGASPFWFVSYKHCDAGRYDFEEMLYCTVKGIEFPHYLPDFEMEVFDIDKVNDKYES